MKQLTHFQNLVYILGGIILLLGLLLWLPRIEAAPYIYCAGALMFASMQLLARYDGRSLTIRRLRHQQIAGALCLVLSGAFMIGNIYNLPYCRRNEWVVVLMIGCIFEVYTAFRIPSEMKKGEQTKRTS